MLHGGHDASEGTTSFNLRGLSENRQVTLEKPVFAADNLAKLLGGA